MQRDFKPEGLLEDAAGVQAPPAETRPSEQPAGDATVAVSADGHCPNPRHTRRDRAHRPTKGS